MITGEIRNQVDQVWEGHTVDSWKMQFS